ncbi:hypothetical protein DFZ12_22985 [Escherichia coli]|nr:hypothetical protein [Escherichia coli]EFB2888430.1 hypothetical protein [Escherichia coli]EFD0712768.1 hypothetical protein [Escherichia coli]EFD0726741.1 hypothetical protein [Escherichia coli]EFD0813095.1 hypothetical protein [Escherichia coli]
MTAWAAGLRHNIRKQNRSIIPVFNTLSVLMKFKSPVIAFFGSQQKKDRSVYRFGICVPLPSAYAISIHMPIICIY